MHKVSMLFLAILVLLGVDATLRAADQPIDIPKLDKIQIDGDGSDWGAGGFRVEALCDSAERIRPKSDFDASFRLGWDERGLLVLVNVTDDLDVEEPMLQNIWQKDSVEFFLEKEAGKGGALWQAVVAPGVSKEFPEMRSQTYDFRRQADQTKELKFEAKRRKTEHGYVIEALMPWENLDIKPEIGTTVAFQLYVNHVDARTRSQASWFPQPGAPYATKAFYTLRLADKPGDAMKAAAWGEYERFRRTRINILASGDLAGKAVTIADGDHPLAAGTLAEVNGRAEASITFAMPPAGQPYGPLSVVVDGKPANTVTLGNPEDRRNNEFASAQIVFKSAVLSSDSFPQFEFDEPNHVEDLIGPYTLRARYFDAGYNEVTRAEKPGRYGAAIDVASEDGKHYSKFTTLFRVTRPIDPWKREFQAHLTLPEGLGIDPRVVENQTPVISQMFQWEFQDNTEHPSNSAVLLAGLYETKPGEPAGTHLNDVTARDYAWWFGLKKKLGLLPHYEYLHYLPDGYDDDPTKKWPVLIVLHPAGANGEDANTLKMYGLPALAEQKKFNQPMILLAPQCIRGESWHAPMLNAFLDDMMSKYRIDPDRVYLAGASMGGMGAYDWAIANPERFAAVAPVCGLGDVADAERIKDLPLWAFHGDKDPLTMDFDVAMFKRMKEIGGRMRLTIYLGGGHGIDGVTYSNPALFEWMLQQSRSKPQQPPSTQPMEVPFQ